MQIKKRRLTRAPLSNKKSGAGFTLIELLVVIAIIGMLTSIVLVSLGPARKRARDAKRQSDIGQISLAMEMCLDDAACAGGGLVGNYPAIAAGTPGRLTTTAIGTYLNPLPQDPGGGTNAVCGTLSEMSAGAYCGWTSSAGGEYCIYAILSDSRVIAASEKGTQFMTAAPTSMSACP